MKKCLWAAAMLVALTACKNNVKQTAEIIDLPCVETPDIVAKAMEGFFQASAAWIMRLPSLWPTTSPTVWNMPSSTTVWNMPSSTTVCSSLPPSPAPSTSCSLATGTWPK